MKTSPFFHELLSAYQSEIDDLTFDSDGKNVLQKRLTEKRKEINFLLQMIELSPEMVAAVFHQGFQFKSQAAMEKLIKCESEQLPPWDSFAGALTLNSRAQELAKIVLKEPMGEWLLTVAAALEYMYGKPGAATTSKNDSDETGEDEEEDDENFNEFDAEEENEARVREEAGADWLVEQGFDRKD